MDWKKTLEELPADQEEVYVRVLNQFGDYTKAVYSESSQIFTVVKNSLVIPAYMVAKWSY